MFVELDNLLGKEGK